MDGLGSVILYGLFFVLMMRFGCGSHLLHSIQKKRRKSEDGLKTRIDPVCGKKIGPHVGYALMYESTEHHFCSRQCLDAFESHPDRYIAKKMVVKL